MIETKLLTSVDNPRERSSPYYDVDAYWISSKLNLGCCLLRHLLVLGIDLRALFHYLWA